MMVLTVILVLLALLLALPVGVAAEYGQSGGRITGYLGPVRFVLYPRSGKKSGTQKAESNQKDEKTNKSGEKSAGSIGFFKELFSLGIEAVGCLRRRLVLKELTLHLTVGARDKEPAQWGLLYGGAWAGIGNLIPALENIFRIENRDIQVFLDENTDEITVHGRGRFRLLVGEILYLLLHYGLQGLKIYKKRKGSNEHGTSHQ